MVGELASRHALSKDVVEGVTERTGGVPLFIEEVTRLLLERGERGGVQAIPPTLQQSLAARLDRLGPAREIAQIGAVLGREFAYSLLRDVAETDEPVLQASLDRLAEVDLLFIEGAPPQATYRFKHALIQDAAYDSLLKSRRQVLHRRVAEMLRVAAGAAVEPELLAHHFTQAGLTEDAIKWWGKAGQRSLERSALFEAVAQFTRALDQIATLPGTPALHREQIKLQVGLTKALMHTKGHAALETKAAVERARQLIENAEALGEPSEDPLLPFSVLWSFWVANYVAFKGDVMRELASELLALAEKQGASVPLMIGHRSTGISLLHTGDIAQCRPHFDRAIALYDPVEHRPLATRFGGDIGVTILSWRSMALWVLGYPVSARADAEHALSNARDTGHAVTLMYALQAVSMTHFCCGNYTTASAQADELVALAGEKGSPLWKAFGVSRQGWLAAMTNKAADAVQIITSAIDTARSTGATLWTPLHLSYLARAFAVLGKFDDAWRCVGEAMTTMAITKETWWGAEVDRVAGKISLMSPEPNAAKA
jgi:tetratricopeptide (TPR) repeat protein